MVFPSRCFIAVEKEVEGGPDVKGSVRLPDCPVAVSVEGYTLNIESEGENVLLVLHTISRKEESLFPSLCPLEMLPNVVAKRWKKELARKKTKQWKCVEIVTFPVRRGSKHLHLITKGPFSNHTCDDDMVESLRSGFVVALRDEESKTARRKYGASPVRFEKGRELPSSKVHLVVLDNDGTMCLTFPSRAQQDIPRRILAAAQGARNKLLQEPNSGSFKGALNLMECFASSPAVTVRHQCINVALGGSRALQP